MADGDMVLGSEDIPAWKECVWLKIVGSKTKKKLRYAFSCECGSHVFSITSRWGVAIVSPEDDALLREYCWTLFCPPNAPTIAYPTSTRYSKDVGDPSIAFLHRIIFGKKGADHIDGNGLNCQRSNLRQGSQSQNMMNRRRNLRSTTGFKGVSQRRGGFRAGIMQDKQSYYLGDFVSAEDAARAYDEEALRRFGEFARLNFSRTSRE